MQTVITVVKFLFSNAAIILAALIALLRAVVGLLLIIPGEQAEKALDKVIAFLEKLAGKAPKSE